MTYKAFPLSLIVIGYLSVGFTSCKKNDDPAGPTTTTLLVYTPNGITTTSSDDWIYVTDENGVLLDSQPYEAGQTVTLKTTASLPTQRINITTFRDFKNSTSEAVTITTHLGIKLNQTLEGLTGTSTSSNPTHNVILTINNLPTSFYPASFQLSTKSGVFYGGGGSFSGSTFNYSSTATMSTTDPSLYVCAADNNGQPYYLEIPNLPNITSTTVNFSSFKPTDHTISLSFPGVTSSIYTYIGIRKGESSSDPNSLSGYVNSTYFGNSAGTIKLGYNDGFNSYQITASATFSKTVKGYFKSGAAVTSIPFLSNTFSLTSTTIDNFLFSLSGNYHQRSSLWLVPTSIVGGLQRNVYWTVNGASTGKQNLTSVISEIKKTFPGITLDNLKYDNSTFTTYLDGLTYDDTWSLNASGGSNGKPTLTEYQTIRFNN